MQFETNSHHHQLSKEQAMQFETNSHGGWVVPANTAIPDGTERLYAVLAQDPKTGVLHLKDIEGHDTIISH